MSRTLQVVWHPNAVKTAVDRLDAITKCEDFNPDDVYRVGGKPVMGMDLMCLVDVGRAVLREIGDES